MMILLLSMLVLVAAVGLGAVVWAARGGPRWVRGAAKVTLVAAELVGKASKGSSRGSSSTSGDSDG
ncbi:hypothetical protein ACFWZ2_20555 [Streptomyces sp. NPDC059002]|uniref:hypothetical protein n=1 Tax=Streptomyces sp. NPDC059002 TaxID=3346690 RepID=UPI00369A8362